MQYGVAMQAWLARQRGAAPWWIFAAALLLLPCGFRGELALAVLCQIGIGMLICLSFNLLLGQGGMLSFGHALYVGMGAFAGIHALSLIGAGRLHWPVGLVPLLGAAGAALLALVLGWVATRRGGTPFAMITLGLGECAWALSQMLPQWLGGEAGLSANRVLGMPVLGISWGPGLQMYGLVACYAFVGTALLYGLTQTPFGRILNAVRDNPERAAFLGFDPHRVRHQAFVLSACFAGLAGALSALHFELVHSEVLSSTRSATYLVFTFLGGTAWFWGPALGAVVMVLSALLFSELTPAWSLYLSLFFVWMVLYAPDGLAGLCLRGLRYWRGGLRGPWRAHWRADLRRLCALACLLAGLSVCVEMGYQLHLAASLGVDLRYLGLNWHASSVADWLLALALAALGAAWLRWPRHRPGGEGA